MWKCPKCEAINYEKGACECCGFNGTKEEPYKIAYPVYPICPEYPCEPWGTPKIWC